MATILRGRRAYTEQQRAEYVARFERSGLTQAEFCRRVKLQQSTFSVWRRAAGAATKPGFAEVRLVPPGSTCPVTLHLPGGTKLEVSAGTEATWQGLGLLLKSLRG